MLTMNYMYCADTDLHGVDAMLVVGARALTLQPDALSHGVGEDRRDQLLRKLSCIRLQRFMCFITDVASGAAVFVAPSERLLRRVHHLSSVKVKVTTDRSGRLFPFLSDTTVHGGRCLVHAPAHRLVLKVSVSHVHNTSPPSPESVIHSPLS